MKNREPDHSASDEADGRWEGPGGSLLVEVKHSNSVRDVRHAFLALAYLLRHEPSTNMAVCVIVDSRLSLNRLFEELHQLREVIHPAIADRIHFLLGRSEANGMEPTFSGSLASISGGFLTWLADLIAAERQRGHRPSLPPRQMVMAALAQLRLWNHPPVTVRYLQDTCQVSYPTVSATLKDLADKGWLEDSGERGVRLRYLTVGEWMELAQDHARQRKVHLFTDPTGQVTPEQLVKRLARLQGAGKLSRGIRIGGVLGASRHYPDLDITAAPRLDLSVDGDAMQVAAMVDAGLTLKTRPEERVALAIHVTRDPWVVTDRGSEEQTSWAGELECLADLIELGFVREASDMAQHMELTNKQKDVTA